jgi:HK97 family phage portal protein
MLLSDSGTVVPFRVGATPAWPSEGLADFSPMRNPQYYAHTGIGLTNVFASYGELYRRQLWVYALVQKVSTSGSRLPLKVFERVSDTDRSEARATPYGQLMRTPNSKLGAKLFWLWVMSTRELYGEAIVVKLRNPTTNLPAELFPLHPSNVIIRDDPDNPGQPEYLYTPGRSTAEGASIRFKATEVIHFRGYNPENTYRGLSACEPLRETLLSEDAMRRGQAALWKNGARPSVMLSTDKTLSEGAIDRLSAQWDAAHSGIDSWGKTAVLEEGVKPTIIQMNPEDMQYLSGRQLNREECCAAWDVPPPAVQILDRATFSNITEQMRSLYRETMGWRVEAYEDTLATQLAPDFASDGSLYAEFLMDSVLRGSFEVRTAAKAQAIQTGQMTPAESRADENLVFIPGSDRLMINAALIPLGEQIINAPATGTTIESAPQKVKGITARDASTLGRRLSAVQSVGDIDEASLVANLEDPEIPLSLLRSAVSRSADIGSLRAWIAASVDSTEPMEALA